MIRPARLPGELAPSALFFKALDKKFAIFFQGRKSGAPGLRPRPAAGLRLCAGPGGGSARAAVQDSGASPPCRAARRGRPRRFALPPPRFAAPGRAGAGRAGRSYQLREDAAVPARRRSGLTRPRRGSYSGWERPRRRGRAASAAAGSPAACSWWRAPAAGGSSARSRAGSVQIRSCTCPLWTVRIRWFCPKALMQIGAPFCASQQSSLPESYMFIDAASFQQSPDRKPFKNLLSLFESHHFVITPHDAAGVAVTAAIGTANAVANAIALIVVFIFSPLCFGLRLVCARPPWPRFLHMPETEAGGKCGTSPQAPRRRWRAAGDARGAGAPAGAPNPHCSAAPEPPPASPIRGSGRRVRTRRASVGAAGWRMRTSWTSPHPPDFAPLSRSRCRNRIFAWRLLPSSSLWIAGPSKNSFPCSIPTIL